MTRALEDLLPYRPALVAAEPGRHMVAETAVMVTTVLGREESTGEEWLYVDVGACNGLMETQQSAGQWRFPLWSSRRPRRRAAHPLHRHRAHLRRADATNNRSPSDRVTGSGSP